MTTLRQTAWRSAGDATNLARGATQSHAAASKSATLTGLEFAVVASREAFDALENDWNELFARAGHTSQLFQAFNWNWHWVNHFAAPGSRTRLGIVTGRRDGRLVMVWPLVKERSAGLTVLAWMGEPVTQYGDVLIEDSPFQLDMLRDAWRFIAATLKPDLARLNKTRADAAVAPLLAELGALSTQQLEAPYLNLASASTFDQYAERYPTKARKNRRRLARRLEEHGETQFRTLAEGPEASRIVAHAIALKRVWLKEKGLVSPALYDPRTLAFFSAAAASTQRTTNMRVAVLMTGDAIAAVEIGFACGTRMAIHIMAYDLAYDKAAAGILLLEQMIEQSLIGGVATYDLMAPGDGYKKEWADDAIRVDDFAIPLTPLGTLFARGYLGFARPRLKAAVAKIPVKLRKALSNKLASAVVVLSSV